MHFTLRARPLRFHAAQALVPLIVLPGFALALSHAPAFALVTLGPLVFSSWLVLRRDRYRLDRCEVQLDGPALEIRYRERRLYGVDLRYATRLTSTTGDTVLTEGDGHYVAFGTDPPDNAYPVGQSGDGEPIHGAWHAVRLHAADLDRLRDAIAEIAPRAPPDPADTDALLQALGSVGRLGAWVEALLIDQLRGQHAGDRPGGLRVRLQDLASRGDRTGQAARRVLQGAR